MMIEEYIKKGLICRIVETEKDRYLNFFKVSYKENFLHSKFVLKDFPRWSIISGYYAMHDITKLFLAKSFNIKINYEVHKTTVSILKEIVKDKELLKLFNTAYKEFISMANDLSSAKKERTKAQYYTGTAFSKEKYEQKAEQFLTTIVKPYLEKTTKLLIEQDVS